MFVEKYPVIGILGGMGPRATIDLYEHILKLTKISQEQDHISTLIYSNPKIPDRTISFRTKSHSKIIYYLQQTAIALEKSGADVILVPCNGSHIYYDNVQAAVDIPVINMIEATVNYVFANLNYAQGIVLLGTEATYESNIYQNYIATKKIPLILPDVNEKKLLMDAIYKVKLGDDLCGAIKIFYQLIKKWDVPIILGCTELPLLVNHQINNQFVNPTEVLARAAVSFVHQKVNEETILEVYHEEV